ncbi:MAG: hypothetical protein GX648_06215 [Crenarchaeota archaeon]|nr:hypothetical protein [Thermoproteota archaeon]
MPCTNSSSSLMKAASATITSSLVSPLSFSRLNGNALNLERLCKRIAVLRTFSTQAFRATGSILKIVSDNFSMTSLDCLKPGAVTVA